MKQYSIRIEGRSPLIMHGQDLDFEEIVKKWRKSPAARNAEKGDDRSPAWSWLGYVYRNDKYLIIPSDNLMSTFREGGAQVTVKGKTSFKALTQSGARVAAEPLLLVNDNPIEVAQILALNDEFDFNVHKRVANELGFTLLVKGCKVGTSRHVRVRPYFSVWSAEFILDVWNEALTVEALDTIWNTAGQTKGIGDWRPGSPKSGSYGTFTAEVTEVKSPTTKVVGSV